MKIGRQKWMTNRKKLKKKNRMFNDFWFGVGIIYFVKSVCVETLLQLKTDLIILSNWFSSVG